MKPAREAGGAALARTLECAPQGAVREGADNAAEANLNLEQIPNNIRKTKSGDTSIGSASV